DAAAVALLLGLGLVEPVDLWIGEVPPIAERDVDPDVAILATGLEQQHAVTAVGGETIGEHAAGAARAGNDGVGGVGHAAGALPVIGPLYLHGTRFVQWKRLSAGAGGHRPRRLAMSPVRPSATTVGEPGIFATVTHDRTVVGFQSYAQGRLP